MLIVANTLQFNGGSTFILRYCKESFARGVKVGVLLIVNKPEKELLYNLNKYADVYLLEDFTRVPNLKLLNNQLLSFMPLKMRKLAKLIQTYDGVLHVMGVFGLLFVTRLSKMLETSIKVSIGVYHQNEFVYNNVDYYFSNYSKRIFKMLSDNGIVFFNEFNKIAYGNFYNIDYTNSVVVPIGIEVPENESVLLNTCSLKKIVSIGNLYDFKTYNAHVIQCLPQLVEKEPSLVYEIYGEGPNESYLKELASSLGISSRVHFKGAVPYSNFTNVLQDCFLFVGSGTAILESAVLGVPSLIGIESTKIPITYGYLHEIDGLSYNEMDHTRQYFQIVDKIINILSSDENWSSVSNSCRRKALDFSINKTCDGFDIHLKNLTSIDKNILHDYSNMRSFLSFITIGIVEKLTSQRKFSGRRDQGTIC